MNLKASYQLAEEVSEDDASEEEACELEELEELLALDELEELEEEELEEALALEEDGT